MQIYGDCATAVEIDELALQLLRQAHSHSELDAARTWLIGCGQLEQLVWDTSASEQQRAEAAIATDGAAAAFYATWQSSLERAPHASWTQASELERSRSAVARIAASGSKAGSLRIPEGFAFYAVFPEQYCAAAVRYLSRGGASGGPVHVIGLRSIGTTLSAAVAVVLRAAGVAHIRYTVRPSGHPFHRELEFPRMLEPGARALVVDEGPGLSGSSFFAAGRALSARGVDRARTAYFCAHDNGPGAMASPEIRDFWRRAERYVAAHHDTIAKPDGSPTPGLSDALAAAFASPCRRILDLAGGRWREHSFTRKKDWPAAYCQFERPKYLAELADGRRIFLKYYGSVLRADETAQTWAPADRSAAHVIARRASQVVTTHGCVARAWLTGRPLVRDDRSIDRVRLIGSALAGQPWRHTRPSRDPADALVGCSGRVSPHDWFRPSPPQNRSPEELPSRASTGGNACKFPETLQGYDHTAIDTETLGWDLAGAIVEWSLDAAETRRLLQLFQERTSIGVTLESVQRHIPRYTEFHAEKALFCAQRADRPEALRLLREARRYRDVSNSP